MNEDLRLARAVEDHRQALRNLRRAAEELIVQQDLTASLAAAGQLTKQTRQGLTLAQENYDRCRQAEQRAWTKVNAHK